MTEPVRSSSRSALTLMLALAAGGCATAHPAASAGERRTGAAPGAAPAASPARPTTSGPAPAAAEAPLPSAPAAPPRTPPRIAAGAPAGPARTRMAASALLVGTWLPADPGPAAHGAVADHHELAGDVALEFKADGTWTISGASYRAAGTFRWVAADEIEVAVVESNLASQVASVSRKRVSVDASSLALTVERRDAKGRADDVAVVTRFRRSGK